MSIVTVMLENQNTAFMSLVLETITNLVNPLKHRKLAQYVRLSFTRYEENSPNFKQSTIFWSSVDHKYYGYRYREIVENQLSYISMGMSINHYQDKLEKFEVEGIYEN